MSELEEQSSFNLNEGFAGVVAFLVRRRRWLVFPFCFISLATIVALSFVPDRYTSTATLLVVQQQVPQRYVIPNSETDLSSALQAMKQQILSRTQLLQMIDKFGLYPKQRLRVAPEGLVGLMLNDIQVVPTATGPGAAQGKDLDSFKITFTAENPALAQQVTSSLTSLFQNEYLRNGTEQSSKTTEFLHQEVEEKGKELEALETRLRDFKLSHVGELPEQQAGNLSILTGYQAQLSNVMSSLERAKQQRTFLQTQLDALSKRAPAPSPVVPEAAGDNRRTAPAAGPVQSIQAEIALLEAERLKNQNAGRTAQYPDVIKNQRALADAQQRLKAAQASQANALPPAERPARGATAEAQTAEDPAVGQLKSNLEANRLEIEYLSNNEKRLSATISEYEHRINQTPVREQQEATILRDTEVLRARYAELQKREQESQLATNLGKSQGGQQFRLIDPASLPVVPSSPQRVKISLGGAGVALAFGLALAFLMELRDTSYRTEAQIAKHISPPFVLGIPALPTAREKRKKKTTNFFEWAAASVMLFVVFAAELLVYRGQLR